MRVLLSTIGSRGDVQPLVALAVEVRARGHEAHLCVPPDFAQWIEGLGFTVTPIGPELRSFQSASAAAAPPSAEQRQAMTNAMITNQFDVIAKAAIGCDVIVGATALQIAAPSIAEVMGIRYVFAAYCPAVLPSTYHAPPVLAMRGDTPAQSRDEYAALWARDSERFSALMGETLNTNRARLGLGAIHDVRTHIFTERPWLASDFALGPWPDANDKSVMQTGAWILPDARKLDDELETFLDDGDPPVYFGFGSMRASAKLGEIALQAARAVGRRVIVSRGWADLSVSESSNDCYVIGEVNQQTLFRRVAAVVHHGGAGTTTAAGGAGVPQVIIPQMYDQHYWAERVQQIGIGIAHSPGVPTAESLAECLSRALRPETVVQAQAIATKVGCDGACRAAERLLQIDHR